MGEWEDAGAATLRAVRAQGRPGLRFTHGSRRWTVCIAETPFPIRGFPIAVNLVVNCLLIVIVLCFQNNVCDDTSVGHHVLVAHTATEPGIHVL